VIAVEMPRNESIAFLAGHRFAHLACALDDQPYVVPIFVAIEGEWLYGFSTVGRKIDWLRQNPRVCIECDEVTDEQNWTSVIVFGRFQELTDTGPFAEAREVAHAALGRHPSWWVPAYVRMALDRESRPLDPVYFRVFIDTITGRRTSTSSPLKE